MVRTVPIPTSVRAAMVVSVSPRPCMRATAAPAFARWVATRLAASASTCSHSWARRSFFQTSTSATLPTSYRKFVASSMFALSRAARASLARRVASTARRRASNLDVPAAVMTGTLKPAAPDVPPPQPHSPLTNSFPRRPYRTTAPRSPTVRPVPSPPPRRLLSSPPQAPSTAQRQTTHLLHEGHGLVTALGNVAFGGGFFRGWLRTFGLMRAKGCMRR